MTHPDPAASPASPAPPAASTTASAPASPAPASGFGDARGMWDARFAQPGLLFGATANAFLQREAQRMAPRSRVLSVADGEGRNSIWLAEQGHAVTAFDLSPVAVAKARAWAAERGQSLDFRAAGWTTGPGRRTPATPSPPSSCSLPTRPCVRACSPACGKPSSPAASCCCRATRPSSSTTAPAAPASWSISTPRPCCANCCRRPTGCCCANTKTPCMKAPATPASRR
uniref:Methyltransferase domain-containing protein n=1 Tax=mine drainage metagenome TaxID=410659 RepID=E6PMG2_9ZZZZ